MGYNATLPALDNGLYMSGITGMFKSCSTYQVTNSPIQISDSDLSFVDSMFFTHHGQYLISNSTLNMERSSFGVFHSNLDPTLNIVNSTVNASCYDRAVFSLDQDAGVNNMVITSSTLEF